MRLRCTTCVGAPSTLFANVVLRPEGAFGDAPIVISSSKEYGLLGDQADSSCRNATPLIAIACGIAARSTTTCRRRSGELIGSSLAALPNWFSKPVGELTGTV